MNLFNPNDWPFYVLLFTAVGLIILTIALSSKPRKRKPNGFVLIYETSAKEVTLVELTNPQKIILETAAESNNGASYENLYLYPHQVFTWRPTGKEKKFELTKNNVVQFKREKGKFKEIKVLFTVPKLPPLPKTSF